VADTKTGAAATSEGAADKTGTTDATKTTEQLAAETKAAADKVVAEQTAAEKAAAEAAGKTGSKDGTADPEPKAPDTYTLTVPDADKQYVEPADLAYIEQVARANKWSNEDAQAMLEESLGTLRQQADRYLAETKADPTYGGDHFPDTQRLAKAVVDKVRPVGHARRESFLRFMGRGGAGNHLEVVAFLADLAKAMDEDTPTHTRAAGPEGKTAAELLYDHPTSQVKSG
jgi:hypothetical protein